MIIIIIIINNSCGICCTIERMIVNNLESLYKTSARSCYSIAWSVSATAVDFILILAYFVTLSLLSSSTVVDMD